jgi:NAD(P)H-hydrate repair Nnr-like enzyme with NAD(P)H-hydrate dehydratase domain
MIELIDVQRSYGGARPVAALGAVSLGLGRERVAVYGTVRVRRVDPPQPDLRGLDQPTTGSILIEQADYRLSGR